MTKPNTAQPKIPQTPRIALKVDVDTLRGTRDGVPALRKLLHQHGAEATFLFSLGPDHTGRAIRRVFRKGFVAKVSRTSVVSHYGFPTLLYGTLLPGPDIGVRCADILRQTRDDGFEVGIHTWDHVAWQDGVSNADEAWTRREMQRAQDRFTEIFKEPARTHGAAGWQMSRHALRATADMGFEYCSDGRSTTWGSIPHYPVCAGEIVSCPQVPTNLPTLDELIGLDGQTADNVHEALLSRTAPDAQAGGKHDSQPWSRDHVFTLHAELEGGKLLPVFERLLQGWKEQGYQLTTTASLFHAAAAMPLPYHAVEYAAVPGRSGTLLVQGIRALVPQPGDDGPHSDFH